MDKSSVKYSKYCLVPMCYSTSIRTPDKIFVSLPAGSDDKHLKKRKLWLRAMRRNADDLSDNTRGFVCEDHFNLEDVDNYIRYKLMGGKIYLKEHVVPHIFHCQVDRKRTSNAPERTSSVKRSRMNLIDTLLSSDNTNVSTKSTIPSNQTVSVMSLPRMLHHLEFSVNVEDTSPILSTSSEKTTQTFHDQRTVSTQYKPYYRSRLMQTDDLQVPKTVSVACSPFKSIKLDYLPTPSKSSDTENISVFSVTSESDTSIRHFSSNESNSSIRIENMENERIKAISIERSKYLAIHKSRLYLGIPEDSYFVVTLLQRYTSCSLNSIYITLKKIKTNLPFSYIGDDFGMSDRQAAKIFSKTVPCLSAFLNTLIYWPSKEKIKLLLPIAFRANYHNVESIIDCFEVEIEKPSDPVKQACTWSDYKKTNTMKYLILSSTPDGLINFVSQGFGGRTTDIVLVEKSEYLKILSENCAVMADRGFKRIDVLLQHLSCTLIRPPSVKAGAKCTKEEVLETKKVAALRIHIERVIRRVREFKILKPHSCINNKTIKYLDHIVIIVCALINLQSGIIRK